jgi:hypothetical protein
MLDQYGIPFFYRQPILICENGRRKIHRPDFTLPTYNNTVIEYDPDRNGDARARHPLPTDNVYRQNGIAALFLDRSDLAPASWQQQLCDRLEEAYQQPLTHPAETIVQTEVRRARP